MKHLLLFCGVILSVISVNAQWHRTHTLYYGGLIVTDSVHYYYSGAMPDSTLSYFVGDGSVTPENADYFHYNEEGLLDHHLNMFYMDGMHPNFQHLYTYDEAGRIVEDLDQYFITGLWENVSRVVTVYDENGITTLESQESWDAGDWHPAITEIFSNNTNGHVSSVYTIYSVTDTVSMDREYIYNEEGLLSEVHWEETFFDGEDEYAVVHWLEYTYNADGQVTYEQHNQIISGFNNYSDLTYTYDDNGNLVHEVGGNAYYTSGGFNYVINNKRDHFYELDNAVNEFEMVPALQIYPNPADYILNVPSLKDCDLYQLISADGKIVQAGTYPQTSVLEIHVLNPGIYTLRVTEKSMVRCARVVVR